MIASDPISPKRESSVSSKLERDSNSFEQPRSSLATALRPPVNDVANTFLLIYASLFPIVNPVGGAPIFLAATRYCTQGGAQRHGAARRGQQLPSAVRLPVRRLARASVLRHRAARCQRRGRLGGERLRLAPAARQRGPLRSAIAAIPGRAGNSSRSLLSADDAADGGTRLHLGCHHSRKPETDGSDACKRARAARAAQRHSAFWRSPSRSMSAIASPRKPPRRSAKQPPTSSCASRHSSCFASASRSSGRAIAD